jgi:hypothetical protein
VHATEIRQQAAARGIACLAGTIHGSRSGCLPPPTVLLRSGTAETCRR